MEARQAPTICVTSPGDLKRIVGAWRPGADRETCISLDFLPPGDRRLRWERELSAWYTDCGCAGGVFGAIGLTLPYLVATYMLHWLPRPEATSAGVLITIGVFVAGSVLGKLAGLAHARMRLAALARLISIEGPPRD